MLLSSFLLPANVAAPLSQPCLHNWRRCPPHPPTNLQEHRQELRLRLLLLFADVGQCLGSSGGGGGGDTSTGGGNSAWVATPDLGALLQPLAVAAANLEPGMLRLLGRGSSMRLSLHQIQSAQRQDASTTRLFRTLWLYTSLHKLVDPEAGLDAAAASGGSADADRAEWAAAAGRLAAVTPMLVVGTDSHQEADLVERLRVSRRLWRCGISAGGQACLFRAFMFPL